MEYGIVVAGEYEGDGLGVGFVKSRKAPKKVIEQELEMHDEAEFRGIDLVNIIVDDSSGADVDRFCIDNLVEWMEKKMIDVLVVNDIHDITKDQDDLVEFILKAFELDVRIISLNDDGQLVYLVPEGEV